MNNSKVTSEIIKGTDEWLFLREGTNNSYSYLTGSNKVDPAVQRQWLRTINSRASLGVPSAHLICPEKLAVFPEFLPDCMLDDRRFARILAERPDVVYPVEALRERINGTSCYPKSDTHFNEAGAINCVRIALEKFGISWEFEPNWMIARFAGDLGAKLTPQQESESLRLANPWSIRSFDNDIVNRGRVMLIQNTAVENRRLLLFGDSFSGLNLARIFSGAFSEVLFVHSLSIDYAVMQRFRPDFVIYELAERFLRLAPNDGLSLVAILWDKICAGEREKIVAWKNDTTNPTGHYIDWDTVDYLLENAGQRRL